MKDIKLPQDQKACADIARNLIIDSIVNLAYNLDDRLAEISVNIDTQNTPEAISIMSEVFKHIHYVLSQEMETEMGKMEAKSNEHKL